MKSPKHLPLLAVFFLWAAVRAQTQEMKSEDRGAATAAAGEARDERRENGTKGDVVPGKEWKHVASVEKAGWSSEKLIVAQKYAGLDSVFRSDDRAGRRSCGRVGRHRHQNQLVLGAEEFNQRAVLGFISAEGVIDVNATLEQMGIDDAPDPLTEDERQARVVDLLRARSGIYHPVDFETPYQKTTRPARGKTMCGNSNYKSTK